MSEPAPEGPRRIFRGVDGALHEEAPCGCAWMFASARYDVGPAAPFLKTRERRCPEHGGTMRPAELARLRFGVRRARERPGTGGGSATAASSPRGRNLVGPVFGVVGGSRS